MTSEPAPDKPQTPQTPESPLKPLAFAFPFLRKAQGAGQFRHIVPVHRRA